MSDAAAPSQAATDASAVKVGRGALLIASAKIVFLITGAVVNFSLASLLGAQEYGDYGVTIRFVSLLNMMVVMGLLQGVSRTVALQPGAAGTLIRQALTPVAIISAGAGGVVLLLSSPLASLLGDARLTPLLMVASGITFAYAFYAALVGVVNGQQRFKVQALLDMGFSTSKMVFILTAAAMTTSALGAVGGFALSAVLMVGVAAFAIGRLGKETPTTPVTLRSLLSFSGWVMAYQALLNLLMFVDLGFIKRAAAQGFLPPEAGGWYTGAVNVAQIPYLGCTAITFVVFPVLGRISASDDREGARSAVRQALRYALLIATPIAGALMAAAPGVLTAIFPASYRTASGALQLLCGAYIFAALTSVACTLLNALGRPQFSAVAVLAGMLSSAGLASALVPMWGMNGAALSSLTGMSLSLVIALVLLRKTLHVELPWASFVRHSVALAVLVGAGSMVTLPEGSTMARLVGVAAAAGAGVVALVLLVLAGEIGREELNLLKKVLGRRGSK